MRYKSHATALAEAEILVTKMEEQGVIQVDKEGYAREAIVAVVAMVREKDISHKDRLAAARTVLDFTMSKPETKSTVAVKRAEDFLSDLANEET